MAVVFAIPAVALLALGTAAMIDEATSDEDYGTDLGETFGGWA